MKRFLCIGLCLAFLFCLAGCGKNTDVKSKKSAVKNSAEKVEVKAAEEKETARPDVAEPAEETPPQQESEPAASEQPSAPQEQKPADNGVVSEYVKTNMDMCEQAAIEYVNYMMANSTLTPEGRVFRDNADGALEARQKYINTASVQFKIRNMDLSPADRAYYNEVSARIDKLFAEMNGQ